MSVAKAARLVRKPLRVGIIGYGTIGSYVAKRLTDGKTLPSARLAAVLVQRPRDEAPAELTGSGAVFTHDPEAFFGADWDIAVEAAGQGVVRDYGARCLRGLRKDFMITSIGALCDDELYSELTRCAEEGGPQLMLAAGAMPAMDWMSSAAVEALDSVTITQTKRPEGWKGTPAEEKVDLDALTARATVFEGCAREAATRFPKNANVAAALALATMGLDSTVVQLVADPEVAGPKIEISLRGAAGELDIVVRGRPAFGSQRTSMVVPLSVVKALLNLSGPQFIGV
mmetsp:Transcript_15494/g.42632  ORF Transcript_15494/g.42632 Transcript_15494/m.42632 type:complete len:285 (-) Transcript_15494:107-961(-)|eukprot:CAMPEP_0117550582 /NCGR_PEP_ID=MMETSP0784-20121206/48755_1 /TAXON_ID=39447 /ORGANISM="" /LENGTH=284 /DNA_ID=CAMNT_0005347605 /DNA_START=32 /DNA_END=886 /DNA_ORIENTATION=+